MIPDSFFKITSDSKNNSLGGVGRDEKRPRTEIPPEKKKDFGRILSNKEKGDGKDDPDEKLIKDDEAMGVKEKDPKKASFLDVSNQTAALTKESKVAPRLGKEKPVAPAEQPWSDPYIEKVDESPKMAKAPTAKEKGDFEQNLTSQDSPALLFGKMAKEGMTPLKQMPLVKKLSEFVPKANEVEVTYKEDYDVGFSLIKPKIQDQDIALINLAVISLASTDLIVNASKLRPVVKIPDFILDMVEKINSEIKPDMTKTVIVLKNAGVLNGVEVTITSFQTARSELNVQFGNLTEEARSILAMNLDALKQALTEKNHTVHMITLTAQKDEPIASGPSSQAKERDRGEEDREGQQKQREQGQEEEA